jgi:hypothetical protein
MAARTLILALLVWCVFTGWPWWFTIVAFLFPTNR